MSDLLPSCCYFSHCALFVLNEDREHSVTSYLCEKFLCPYSIILQVCLQQLFTILSYEQTIFSCYLPLTQDTKPISSFYICLKSLSSLVQLILGV